MSYFEFGTQRVRGLYDVLDHNDDSILSTDVWWIACATARENGFRVRDNCNRSMQADFTNWDYEYGEDD